jgi:glycosyltransferase involved in cell wall biosynthesis
LLLPLSIGRFGSDHRFVRIYTALRLSESPRPHRDMKILHTIRTLDPAWGGPVEGVRNLVSQALLHGHNAEVVCADDPASSWLEIWNVKVHAVGSGRLQYGFTTGLDRWLSGNLARFDVVVVHGIWMYFGYAVWKATRRIPVPYFLFTHGALDPWFKRRYPLKHVKKTIYWKALEHKVLRDAERVLFTTEEEMLLAYRAFLPYQCRAEITGYGISRPDLPDNFGKGRSIGDLTATHPELGNRNFILYLGRVHEKKGIDLLLRAFSASKAELPNMALVIAGPGDETIVNKLTALASSLGIAGQVIWAGPIYGSAKWNLLRSAEVYILPSHQENFGIGVVEALACATPVLVSDKVNIWREIESAGAGLVAPDDVEGCIGLLKGWAALSSEEKSRMSVSAKGCFENHFDITVTSERYFTLLQGQQARVPA